MKKFFTLTALLISLLVSAQEAGKTGELLKNEASSREMQTANTSSIKQVGNTTSTNSNRSNNNSDFNRNSPIDNRNNNNANRNNQRYNWNQNRGYSEVFVRIPENGYFTVEIGNQAISSDTGKFRFFDLNSGKMALSIYENGYLLYRTQLNVRNETRLVLDYFTNYGLYLLDSYPLKRQMYGFNEWDDVWNNSYQSGNGNGNWNNGNGGGNWNNGNQPRANVMDNQSFDNFTQTIKRTATFDKEKVEFIQQQTATTLFTSQQIKTLLKMFTFDDKKVQAGKILYKSCVDPNNFYIVYDAFDFETGRKELRNFVSSLR